MREAAQATDELSPRLNRALGVIFVFALIVRLAFVLWYPQVPIVNDAASYNQGALELVSGQGAHFSKGPVYQLMLAAIYGLWGFRPMIVRVVQALISFLSVVFVYALGRRVFGRRVGIIASLLASVYPPFISYTGWLLTETLSVFLLLALIYLVIRAMHRPGVIPWISAGVVAGIAVLNREEVLLITLLITGLVWWSVGRRQAIVLLVSTMLAIAPWTIRNYRVYGQFVLISTMGGPQLWVSTHEPDWGLAFHDDDPYYRSLTGGLDHLQTDKKLLHEGIKNILSKPGTYLRLCMKRIPRFWVGGHSDSFVSLEQPAGWYLSQGAYVKVMVKLFMLMYNLGIIVLGFRGWFLAAKLGSADSRQVFVLGLPIAVKAVVHFFLTAGLRYQVPIMSFLIIFAAFTLWHVRSVVMQLLPVQGTAQLLSDAGRVG